MKTKSEKQKTLLNLSLNSCNHENQEKKQKTFISKAETINSLRIFYVISDSKEIELKNKMTL